MRLVPILALLVLPACSVGFAQLDPRPNVLLVPSRQTLALQMAPAVREAFVGEIESSIPTIPDSFKVSEWRETLTTGFRAGVARYFAVEAGRSDLTLVVLQARPSLVMVKGATYDGQVRYQAELVDASGRIVKTWADTAISRRAGNMMEADLLVTSAVESMYEQIANGMPVPNAS